MTDWAELTRELERLLHLRTYPIAYKKLDNAAQLDEIPKAQTAINLAIAKMPDNKAVNLLKKAIENADNK